MYYIQEGTPEYRKVMQQTEELRERARLLAKQVATENRIAQAELLFTAMQREEARRQRRETQRRLDTFARQQTAERIAKIPVVIEEEYDGYDWLDEVIDDERAIKWELEEAMAIRRGRR